MPETDFYAFCEFPAVALLEFVEHRLAVKSAVEPGKRINNVSINRSVGLFVVCPQ